MSCGIGRKHARHDEKRNSDEEPPCPHGGLNALPSVFPKSPPPPGESSGVVGRAPAEREVEPLP